MSSFFLVFTFFLAISAAINLGVGWYALLRREVRGAKALAVQIAGTTWWTIGYALTIVFTRMPGEGLGLFGHPMFWYQSMFMGVVLVPGAFLVFTLQFVDQGRWVNRYTLSALAVEPLLVVILVWTDPFHQLFFAGYTPGSPGGFTGGAAFWLHSGYSYLLTLLCYALLGWSLLQASRLQRRQTVVLLLGIAAVTVSNLLTIFKAMPPGVDLTPIGFMITGLAMVYNIRGRGFLDLIPVARNAVVESMSDAVLVIDGRDRVLDSNPAVLKLLALRGRLAPGTPVSDFFGPWQRLAQDYPDPRRHFTSEIPLMEQEVVLEVQVTPLFGKQGEPLGRILVLRDITPMKQVEAALRAQLAHNEALRAELQELVVRDALTGLYNRRYLEQTLLRDIAQAARAERALAVCIIDIDSFKPINDTYGHSAGDRVLKGLAELMLKSTRKGDIACRFGGEEFVLVMPEAALTVALQRIDQLRQEFSEQVFHEGEHALRVTFSAGVAVFPKHGGDAQSLLVAADKALYRAKAEGRNRVMAADGVRD